jgi:hypothetical protein
MIPIFNIIGLIKEKSAAYNMATKNINVVIDLIDKELLSV